MDQFEKKEIVQAILIADNNVENFRPFSDEISTALLPIVNVSMLDYALEALNKSGIEEVFIYTSLFLNQIREHIKQGIASFCSWSVNMSVHVIGGERTRSFGEAMRDMDAKALIRGNFILLGADTITNVKLKPIFEEHKKHVKYDKGAAATVIFKEANTRQRTGNEVMIALNAQNNRLHHHQRIKTNAKETDFEVPLEVFINNSQIVLHHNLLDPQIAIGSPSMLSLFSDNFDFETRDDFIHGILINEDILDSRIYVSLLSQEQYARKVNNWQVYQIVSQDIINRWAYPIVPDMGVHCLYQNYIFLRKNIYKSPTASVRSKVGLRENVVVQAGSSIASGTSVSCSVIGKNCKIGQDCQLHNAYIMDNVVIENGCILEFCVIGSNAVIGTKSLLAEGTVIGPKCVIPAGTKLEKAMLKSALNEEEDFDSLTKLAANAYIINDKPLEFSDSEDDNEDDDAAPAPPTGAPKMSKLPLTTEDSDYTSSSDEDESRMASPIPDDTNIFLSEVMDSLMRGYEEKSNPDFLILEINSSRYAYNMSLKEVNFYVVKAIFGLQMIMEPANNNVLVAINNVLKQLGPVMSNYIKTEDAMLDGLKALEDIYDENSFISEKISQVVHYLYDKDYVTEEAIKAWYEQLEEEEHRKELQQKLSKLIEWLDQSSDEDDDDDDDESD